MKKMKFNQRKIAIFCVVLLVALSGVTIWRQRSASSDIASTPAKETSSKSEATKESAKPEGETKPAEEAKPEATSTYSYTAVSGSTYTGFAREAINAYATKNGLTLSAPATLSAEVALANNAGSPLLEVGQVVTISLADVKNALSEAGIVSNTTTSTGTKDTTSQDAKSSKSNYTTTAKAGDSYTLIARQAITNYLTTAGKTLSPAQRVAAESFLTKNAGTPQLVLGQNVTISNSDVEAAVTQASNLNQKQQTAWNAWAANVVF